MDATSLDPLQHLEQEIARKKKEIAGYRDAIRACESALESLERVLRNVTGQTAATFPSQPVGHRRGSRSDAVVRRKEAMMALLRTGGPMGPSDLLVAVRASLNDEAISRPQIVDLLRRSDAVFVPIGDGRWTVREAKHGLNGHALTHSEEAMG